MTRPILRPAQRELLIRLGSNLRRERLRCGYTQEHLAELAELHPRMIQKIEAGQTNIVVTTALRLQAALDCPWPQLLPKLEVKKTPLR